MQRAPQDTERYGGKKRGVATRPSMCTVLRTGVPPVGMQEGKKIDEWGTVVVKLRGKKIRSVSGATDNMVNSVVLTMRTAGC